MANFTCVHCSVIFLVRGLAKLQIKNKAIDVSFIFRD